MIRQHEMTFQDYVDILQRRKWLLIIPAVLCSIGAYCTSLLLASRWTSETVVLVQEPAVPDSIVRPIISGDLNQRLATMKEEILSRTRLQQIIEKFGLYKQEAGRRSTEELVARLRGSIDVSPVRPMAETRYNGLPGFTVSVTASQPQLAQAICTEITSIFMKQNVVFRERRTEDTSDFLARQMQDAKAKLDEQDAKVAEFQRRYMGELPEEMQTNFSMLTALSSQLETVNQALNRLQQDKLFLESTLSQQLAANKAPEAVQQPERLVEQVAALQNQLVGLQGRFTEEHPDVIRIKKEIANLQKRMHEPSVNASSAPPVNPEKGSSAADSPHVQQLKAQLYQIDVTIGERTAEQARLRQNISRLQAKLESSPGVAQQYKLITRDYQTALNVYTELLRKQSDSKMAADLEHRQQGEQFHVLDAPSLPQTPTFPKRPAFALGGLMGGLALGLGITFLLEARDTTLRSERDIELALKLPMLGWIPEIEATKNGMVATAHGRDGKKSSSSNLSAGVH